MDITGAYDLFETIFNILIKFNSLSVFDDQITTPQFSDAIQNLINTSKMYLLKIK
jgi:hypothetical protein